jgi:hypothetical protein
MRTRRVLGGLAVCALLVAVISVASAAAAPSKLSGNFRVLFPKGHPVSNAPCPPDEFCGVGSLAGFGRATITILDESFEEIPGSPCLEVHWTLGISPIGQSDQLVLESQGTFCPPGRSADSQAGANSYGHPGFFQLNFTIDGTASSGIFADASGSGQVRFVSAGGVGLWRVAGELALAS